MAPTKALHTFSGWARKVGWKGPCSCRTAADLGVPSSWRLGQGPPPLWRRGQPSSTSGGPEPGAALDLRCRGAPRRPDAATARILQRATEAIFSGKPQAGHVEAVIPPTLPRPCPGIFGREKAAGPGISSLGCLKQMSLPEAFAGTGAMRTCYPCLELPQLPQAGNSREAN